MTVTLTEKAEFRLWAFVKGSATDETNNATKGVRIS
ncbi:MAG: iron-sulfur cluster assembly accessory protein, partial [Dolichospermum sp.]